MRVSHLRPGRALSLLALRSAVPARGAPALALAAPRRRRRRRRRSRPLRRQPPLPAKTADPRPSCRRRASIIDRHIEAVGGRKAILAHSSSHATRNDDRAGQRHDRHARRLRREAEQVARQDQPSAASARSSKAFDGKIGWSLSPMTGPRLTEGKELEEKKFDADFYSDLHEDGRYASMTTVDKIDVRRAAVLQGQPRPQDRRGGFRVLRRRDRPEGGRHRDPRVPDGTDDRHAGPLGLQEVRRPAGADDAEADGDGRASRSITLTAIEFDTVDPSVFEPPAPIKALIK